MATKKAQSSASAPVKSPQKPVVKCVVILKSRDGFGQRGELRNFAEATLAELGVERGVDWRPATDADKAIGRVAG